MTDLERVKNIFVSGLVLAGLLFGFLQFLKCIDQTQAIRNRETLQAISPVIEKKSKGDPRYKAGFPFVILQKEK